MSEVTQDSAAEDEIGLADAIGQVRAELERAIVAGADAKLAFRAESVELEFEVALSRTVGGETGVRVWVVSAGAKGERSSSRTHRVKVVVSPIERATGQKQNIGDTGSI